VGQRGFGIIPHVKQQGENMLNVADWLIEVPAHIGLVTILHHIQSAKI